MKEEVQSLLDREGVQACHQRLSQLDPKSAAALHPNDRSRVIRALQVFLETGKSIKQYQEIHGFEKQRYQVCYLGRQWSREELYDRINQRVHLMVEQGLVEEVRELLDQGYTKDLPSMSSIGYKQAVAYLSSEISLDNMIADIQQKSRHYAKKQLTWYRKDPRVHWLSDAHLSPDLIKGIRAFLDTGQPAFES
ncbi:MAG: tRNA (adenosine(37)-N6)-dimethylallyltransferase MiaA [SAR324 cluster bacterium]|uniref:tRNA dimethylallyltransferase n=1 Tax=SAR324 cluster bacterium TaxID=2024889 RepID=A0A2A4T1E4_9DELT|nr:MAG: tRNA (adenosine(37)-N6)-dimethylallyltransferase MiaA [SAR324 cluster bacterium]